MSVEVLFHAGFGALGLISGMLALWARKGSLVHRRAGTVFFAVMMATAASGAYFGFRTSVLGNAIAGIVTIYLLTTSWMTIRRPEKQVGVIDMGAFLFATSASVAAFWSAFAAMRSGAALLGGIPYLVIASIVAFAALADLSVLLRRGLSGRQRIARHLWRMLLGFAAAVGSFFPGQLSFFPQVIQDVRPTILLFVPFFGVLAVMFGWLIVVLFTRWHGAAGEELGEVHT